MAIAGARLNFFDCAPSPDRSMILLAPRTLVLGRGVGVLILKTGYTVALSMIAGVGLGAAAIQGLHAQATPKALLVTESEIVDRAKVPPYSSVLTPAMQAAGGQWAGGGTGPRENH